MGTATKAFKWIAGLLMAITFISAVLMIFVLSMDGAKTGSNDAQAMTTELSEQRFMNYDNNEVSGSQVISALRKFETQGKDQKIAIYVETGRNVGAGTWYYSQFGSDQVTASSVTSIEKAMKPTDNNYINPSGRFNGTIERDTNGVIRAVKFVQR
ncbi:hypothetical protein [Lysinibacillus sp. OL1]|uniref:hypothetical protein n=1 Tax=Lysinibacillus sp. OL1 TaxID=2517243 RepID=UPI00103E2630|nr:hypothetical protein [Lysinibacillus sp. OL1]TBV85465.1 hypothetical protein EW028_21170 [Lysinibacillus sp. OL1]